MTGPAGASYITSARFSWIMVVIALAALAFPAYAHMRYGRVHWTVWAVPALTIFNLVMMRVAWNRLRLTTVWLATSIAITLAMFAWVAAPMLRR